jgi:hypothetical protein
LRGEDSNVCIIRILRERSVYDAANQSAQQKPAQSTLDSVQLSSAALNALKGGETDGDVDGH